jgi:hypothetical protein
MVSPDLERTDTDWSAMVRQVWIGESGTCMVSPGRDWWSAAGLERMARTVEDSRGQIRSRRYGQPLLAEKWLGSVQQEVLGK